MRIVTYYILTVTAQVGRCKERLIFAESFTTPDGRSLPTHGANDALRWLQNCDLIEPFVESEGERDDLGPNRTAYYYSTASALAQQLEDIGGDGEDKNRNLLMEMQKMYTLAEDTTLAQRAGAQIETERLLATLRKTASSQEGSIDADASIDKQASEYIQKSNIDYVFFTTRLNRWSKL